MSYLFDPPAPVIAATSDGVGFPVRRVFCVGRNYAGHAREMGSDPVREPPFFFTKWAEAVVPDGATIAYPSATHDYQFEAELVVAIGAGGRDIAAARAADHIYGYAAGLDMTRRDLQAAAKATGRPWDVAKNVEQSAPLGVIRPAATTPLDPAAAITLHVGDTLRQQDVLGAMIWSVAEIVATLSTLYRLEPGDLIYTGTPEGVGPVSPGDVLRVSIDGLADLCVTIGPRA